MTFPARFWQAAGGARRSLLPWLSAAFLGLAVVSPAPGIPAAGGREASVAPAPRGLVQGVEAIAIVVADMDRSVEFFSRILDFEKVSDREVAGGDYERLEGVFGLRVRAVRMRLGDEAIELNQYLAPAGRPVPADSRSNDLWFQHVAIIVSDMDRAYARLREHRVEHASSGPQRLPDWNSAAGGIRAFYFKDPDGHPLEILQFPAGKGDPKWHRESDRLFLGIDHTAIVVSDTASSLRLYRDALGMRVAGESENFGTEQEHLNNVFGARLRITGLRAATGPGIEFLEYMAPSDGRRAPADARSNDLASWQTRLLTDDASAVAAPLRGAGGRLISPGRIEIDGGEPGFRAGLLARDPDGHALLFIEPYPPNRQRSARIEREEEGR